MYDSDVFDDLSGVALAAAVGRVDVTGLDAEQALGFAVAARRVGAWAAACEAAGLAGVVAGIPPVQGECGLRVDVSDLAMAEIAAAYGVSSVSAGRSLRFAEGLRELPQTAAALRAGRIDLPRAWLLIDTCALLTGTGDGGWQAAAAAVQTRLLDAHAAAGGRLPLARWRRLAARTALEVDPDAGRQRQDVTRRGRRTWHRGSGVDAEGTLGMCGPVETTAACEAAVDDLARCWRADGRVGTLDQLRFDAMADLLTRHLVRVCPDDVDPGDPGNFEDCEDCADCDGCEGCEVPAVRIDRTGQRVDDLAAADDGDLEGTEPEPEEAARAGTGQSGTRLAGIKWGCGGSGPGDVTAGVGGLSGVDAVLHLTVPLSTLLGCEDAPGDLAGVGAIPADLARELAASASVWHRLLTDPVDGHLVVQDVRRYRPTAAQRRYVLARWGQRCAAYGCTARRSLQLDHVVEHPAGATNVGNLVPLCPRHHNRKTQRLWHHAVDPLTGELVQTSPLGLDYTSRPEPPPGAAVRPPPGAPDDVDGDTDLLHRVGSLDKRLDVHLGHPWYPDREYVDRLPDDVDPHMWARIEADERTRPLTADVWDPDTEPDLPDCIRLVTRAA